MKKLHNFLEVYHKKIIRCGTGKWRRCE